MYKYTVHYQYATYSGDITIYADDEEEALRKARAWRMKQGSMAMAYESYKITNVEDAVD